MVRMKPVCISEDLRIEILLHLPVKSLLRFKSVCKEWHSLISSRRFCFLHTLRCSTTGDGAFPAAVLLRRWDLDYYHLSLRKATPLTLPGYIIQSCNGLLLVRCYENAPGDYIICNLATGQCRTLDYVHNNDECLTLVFDPSVSPYYKLICVKAADFLDSPFCYQIVVFDSESSSWSVVVKNFTAPVDAHLQWVFSNCGVYWNNAVHWNRTSGGLVYFDIGKGKINLAPKGPWMHQTRYSGFTYFVMESGGHLHYIMTDGSQLSVYEMERDYSQWSFKYHIEYDGISFTSMDDKVIGIMRSPNENSEKSFVLFNVSGKLMVYNLIDASFHELTGDLGMEEFNMERGPRDVHQFIETMAPV